MEGGLNKSLGARLGGDAQEAGPRSLKEGILSGNNSGSHMGKFGQQFGQPHRKFRATIWATIRVAT